MPTKQRRTLYPDEAVEAARRNVEQFEWAKRRREEAVEEADRYLEGYGGLDGLWRLVTSQEIPRSCTVSFKNEAGSPITGTQFNEEHGSYGWEADPFEAPWKLTDPTCEMQFPTNDFGAYYESGLDEAGEFDPELADDDLLVNELYPERGESWGVDDGTGWVDDEGNRYHFVAYYNHWHCWYEIREILQALRDAFLLDGDREYAQAGIVLLDRVADVYPSLDLSAWGPEAELYNSDAMSGQGRTMGCIWESVQIRSKLSAYDAFFPVMDDETAVAFLSDKADVYEIEGKGSGDAIRKNVEEGIVREVLPAVECSQIRGNFGHHQAALAMAGVVLDEPDGYTADALAHVFRPGEYVTEDDGTPWGRHEVTGGDVYPHLVEVVDRDGQANESPNYNAIVTRSVREIAEVLDGYDGTDEDLYEHPKVERMLGSRIPLLVLDRFTPHIGDSEETGNPGLNLDEELLVDAAARYDDPQLAQAAALAVEDLDEIHGDVFDPDPERHAEVVQETLDAEGPLDLPSGNLAGFGLALLRQGENSGEPDETDDRRVAWVGYGRNSGEAGGSWHNHLDTLNLGLFGYGLNLAPDLGYPALGSTTPKRRNWAASTVSHNTVVVDAQPQKPQWVSEPKQFASTGEVDLIDVAAPEVYPQADEYRRTTAMVRFDDERSYVVDFFRVAGGEEHHFSFHAGEGEATAEGLDLLAQPEGTYAGPDVPRPGFREDTEYNQEVGNGFNYFDAVERDEAPPDSFSVDWDIVDTWDVREDGAEDVGVRLTMCNDLDEVALVDGEAPAKPGNPERLRYLLAKREGEELDTTFTSVIEPYEGEPVVESVELVGVEAADGSETDPGVVRAVKITLDDGRVDYAIRSSDPSRTYLIDEEIRFQGFFGVYREEGGEPAAAVLSDGTELGPEEGEPVLETDRGRLAGTVADFTRELAHENELVVEFDGDVAEPEIEACVGEWIYVETDHDRNGAYEIQGAEIEGGQVVLDVGDRTTVRGYVDPEEPEQGFEYIPEEGARFTIPRTYAWD